MNAWQYIGASLRHYRRVHLAVAAGVAVATAVITGALLVGDSVRGSLRELGLRGLGRIDAVVLSETPFRAALAAELHASPHVAKQYKQALPLLLTPGAATRQDEARQTRRATGLNVVGITPEFWSLASPAARSLARTSYARSPDATALEGNEVALSENVARELGAAEGDFIVLRLPSAGAAPADSSLGEKEDATVSRRLRVARVFDDAQRGTMARFALRPSQQPPRNAFVPLETLAELLEIDGRANAILLASDSAEQALPSAAGEALRRALKPTMADYGVTVEEVRLGAGDRSYIRIAADRLVAPPHLVEVAQRLFGGLNLQPAVTYLANTIVAGDRKIPYSTVVGVDSTRILGPVVDDAGNPIALAADEVALNEWAARELDASIGDEIALMFYEPETTHGQLREHAPVRLKLRAILPLADAAGRPTAAADPHFAPELPGVTDQESIDAWELPFELVEEVRDQDEAYWDERRTTPKAFVSYELAASLWATRWGTASVLRLPRRADTPEQLAYQLREALRPSEMGVSILPVKQKALAAAAGTTPFDGLFLGFSFFLMASAVMLTVLLFRLGVEGRAREVGLLLAAGVSPRRLRRLLLGEALAVAALGAVLGAAAGVGYARLMVYGLNTWWVEATTTPFLELHVTPQSLLAGMAAGLGVALVTMMWSLRRFSRLPARQLLAGDAQPPLERRRAAARRRAWLPPACFLGALALGLLATTRQGEAQAGAFFGGGVLALVGILVAVGRRLREPTLRAPAALGMAGLALRNARRNPSRTMLSLALAATASFLIVALSAFRLAPTERGTGGFDLLATADLPLHFDLNTDAGRDQLGFSAQDSDRLAAATTVAFRVNEGEDASCLNLYQTTQPRILGAPPTLGERSLFQWAMTRPEPAGGGTPPGDADPWRLLDAKLGNDADGRPIVPMVLDRNTAFYSLKLYAVGDRLTVRDGAGRPATLEIVGMLANSVLQGDVIISEPNFLRLFPEVAGRRFFLIRLQGAAGDAERQSPGGLAKLLETSLEDFGFDAVDAQRRLAELMAVQNTYLSTFQSLGALGLLLGAIGLAVVQLRSMLERRGELALMQAAGFRRRRLMQMVLAENFSLLAGGLGIGSAAALAVVLPHALTDPVGTPWRTLALLLALVALAGAAAAWIAARAALRAPLVPALRGD